MVDDLDHDHDGNPKDEDSEALVGVVLRVRGILGGDEREKAKGPR